MSNHVSVEKPKKKRRNRDGDPPVSNEGADAPRTNKKKKHRHAETETAPHDEAALTQPYTDASTFISFLGGNAAPPVDSPNEGDAVTVVQNFDSSQIQNALKHLQQASGSEPARPTSGTPIAVPLAGSHSSRPQQVARRTRQPPQPIRPGSYADVPPPLHQKPVSSNAVREGASQPAPPALSAEVLESHRSILSEKWLQTGQLKELEKTQGLVYKKGKFSRIEDQQLEFAIENFRKQKGLSDEDIENIIFTEDRNKGIRDRSQEFWSSITAALHQRPIIAVYHHMRRIRNPMRQGEGGTGAWTPEQDQALLQAIQQFGHSWEKVSQAVIRSSGDCRDRYRNHLSEGEQKRTMGKWSKEEEEELIQIVQDMKEKLDLDDGDSIFWKRVSEKMGGRRGRQQCQAKWSDQLSRRVKAHDGSLRKWTPHDSHVLLGKIGSLNVRDDSEIDWSQFPDNDWTFSAHVIQRKWRSMKTAISGWEDMTHADIMKLLRSEHKLAQAPRQRQREAPKSAPFVLSDDEEVEEATPVLQELESQPVGADAIDTDPTPTELAAKHKKNKKKRDAVGTEPNEALPLESASPSAHEDHPRKKKKKRPVISDDVTTSPAAVGDDIPAKTKKKKKSRNVETLET